MHALAGATAGGAGVNPNAAAAASSGPSLAAASGTNIPGGITLFLSVLHVDVAALVRLAAVLLASSEG